MHDGIELIDLLKRGSNKLRFQGFCIDDDLPLALRAMQGQSVNEAKPALMDLEDYHSEGGADCPTTFASATSNAPIVPRNLRSQHKLYFGARFLSPAKVTDSGCRDIFLHCSPHSKRRACAEGDLREMECWQPRLRQRRLRKDVLRGVTV